MKGRNNHIIRKAIKEGLRLNDKGDIVLPNGNVCVGAKGGANGYKKVWLKDNGRNVGFTKARLVCWLAYGEPPAEDAQVDHINHDRTDDRPENLRWSSAQENSNNITKEERERRKRERETYHAEYKRLKESHEDLVKALQACNRPDLPIVREALAKAGVKP